MLILGVETSGLAGSVALRRDGKTVESVSLQQAGRRHAQTLVSEVDALLRRAGFSVKQLNAVAVSIGPGSFTGLRVGVVFAKTLAYATGCPLVAVDTFRAIAAASPEEITDVVVISDAQRGDLFVGNYVRQSASGDLLRDGEIKIESIEAFQEHLRDACSRKSCIALTGPACAVFESATALPSSIRILAPTLRLPNADLVAAIAEQQALAGDYADPWRLEPFYLRRSAAEEKAAL